MFVVAVIVLHSMRYSGKYFENMRIAIETGYTLFSRMLSIVTFTMPFFVFTAFMDFLLSNGFKVIYNLLAMVVIFMLGQIFEHSGVSILIGLICLYLAYRVMGQKDITAVIGKNKPEPKDKEGFCRDTGKIIIFFAVGSFLMAVVELLSPMAALIQMIVWVVITFVLWKKVNDKYY